MKEMLIIGVDVGSVAQGNFAWCDSDGKASTSILELRDDLNDALASGRPVAVSFECPLSVPCPDDEALLSRSRPGEGNRSFLAGAGASATLTGLQELLWLLGEVRKTHPATRA